jgi:hypothetical protein
MGCGPINHTSTGPTVTVIAEPVTAAKVTVTLEAPDAGRVCVTGPITDLIRGNLIASESTAVSPATCPEAIRKTTTGMPPGQVNADPFGGLPVICDVMLLMFETATDAILSILLSGD